MLSALLTLALLAPVLWRDPGRVEEVDFVQPAGGAACPTAPLTFVSESFNGMSPKVMVRDSAGVEWQVKGGPEARADAFSTRLVGALGYYAEAICFVAHGRIDGIRQNLRRAWRFIQPDGAFSWASFERRDSTLHFSDSPGWTWVDNPFRGSAELDGLKILVMLLSNWDNKDARNNWQGSNTGVLKDVAREIYFVTDWGQTLGPWRGILAGHPWDCALFTRQTPAFLKGSKDGVLQFGFRGQHTAGFRDSIPVEHGAWLMRYLSHITDAQLRSGLLASGATPQEQECFTKALRTRIEQLSKATITGAPRPQQPLLGRARFAGEFVDIGAGISTMNQALIDHRPKPVHVPDGREACIRRKHARKAPA